MSTAAPVADADSVSSAGGINLAAPVVSTGNAAYGNVDTAGDSAVGIDTTAANIGKKGIPNGAADKGGINVRQGRRIQVDGFLLEWSGADTRVWPGSLWRWDAVSTVDGVAGYVSLPVKNHKTARPLDGRVDMGAGANVGTDINADTAVNAAPACTDWVFTISAANTGRSFDMKIPERLAGENFAVDRGAFDSGDALTAEWVVPWDFLDDGGDADVYALTLSAASACGDTLPPVSLSVAAPGTPRSPSGLLTQLAMVIMVAALTVTLAVLRKRSIRKFTCQ